MLDQSTLKVKPSTLPGAGNGLFTNHDIKRGTIIVEYLGTVHTWAEIKNDINNPYLCYINKSIVINAAPHPEHLARYANDALGPTRIEGVVNNSFLKEMVTVSLLKQRERSRRAVRSLLVMVKGIGNKK